jgi:hypothetical protein
VIWKGAVEAKGKVTRANYSWNNPIAAIGANVTLHGKVTIWSWTPFQIVHIINVSLDE